jgi:phage terminase small subunit
MSPSVPLSRFVDEEALEPSVPTQPIVQPVEGPMDWGALSPQELAAQLRAQLECESFPPPDMADGRWVEEGTESDETPKAQAQPRKRATNGPRTLSAKQQRFIDEYLVDLNATQAAIRAGYSKRTARAIGCENLTKPDIRTKIHARLRESEDHARLDRQRHIEALLRVVNADIRQLFDQEGKILPVEAWPEGVAPAVALYESKVTGTPGTKNYRRVTRIALKDKIRAVFTLLDYLGPKSKHQ